MKSKTTNNPQGGRTLEKPRWPRADEDWALFLDVDGTLIDFAATPDAVRVPPGLVDLLGALCESLGGALTLLSGRRLEDLDDLFAPLRLPAAGQHGLERRGSSGTVQRFSADPQLLARLRAELNIMAAEQPGLLLEDKGAGLALHYRNAPEYEEQVVAATAHLAQSTQGAFEVQRGQFVCELKPVGFDKGSALAAFMDETPFAARTPVCIGDDLTDEHAFAEAHRHGGISILIGERRPTGARFGLASPADLHRWLRRLLGRLSNAL